MFWPARGELLSQNVQRLICAFVVKLFYRLQNPFLSALLLFSNSKAILRMDSKMQHLIHSTTASIRLVQKCNKI